MSTFANPRGISHASNSSNKRKKKHRREVPIQTIKSLVDDSKQLISNNGGNIDNSPKVTSAVLRNLSSLDKFGKNYGCGSKMMASKADSLLLDILQISQNTDILTLALQTIRYFKGDLYSCFNKGLGAAVTSTMREYANVASIQAAGCFAIRALAVCRANCHAFISPDLNALVLIREAMHRHMYEVEVQKGAVSGILCLVASEEAAQIVHRHGLYNEVIVALRLHPKQLKIYQYGLQVLKSFDCKYSIVRAGAANSFLASLQNHRSVDFVVVEALKCVRDYAILRSNTETFVKLNMPSSLVKVVTFHTNNEVVQYLGVAAIYRLISHQVVGAPDLVTEDDAIKKFIKARVHMVLTGILKNPKQKAIGLCLTCTEAFCCDEVSVKSLLGARLITYLVSAGTYLTKKNERNKARKVLGIFNKITRICPEFVSTIMAEATEMFQRVEETFGLVPHLTRNS